MQFTADLKTLNANFGSNASGSAILSLDAPSQNIRTLNVQINADGLEDLTGIEGGIHVAHIHGQFLGNEDRPLLEQGDGAFFDGTGGITVDSELPTIEDSDLDGDGFINFLEGRPSYGPIVLNLTSEQIEAAPEGTPPLSNFLELAGEGEINPAELFPSGTEFNLDTTYTFDLTNPDELRQYNNLVSLDEREIVLHGLTIPVETSEAIDETAMGTAPAGTALDNGEAFRITAPVAAGTIEQKRSTVVSELVALTDDNTLVSFDSNNPEASNSIDVSGLEGVLLGIDTRPADGLIYGITTANNIYTIDANSGEATYISTLDTPFEGGTISGFDFNPVADRLRLVGDNDQDFRINVDTGEVTVDGTLAFAEDDLNSGVNPKVTAAAYTNSFDGTISTQLYDIDTLLNDLVLQNPPNDGTLVTVGDLGIDFGTLGGFDIVSAVEGDNTAFAVSNTTLYSIDLDTGAAESLGEVGSNHPLNLQGLTAVSSEKDATPDTLIDLSDLDAQSVHFEVYGDAYTDNMAGFYVANADGSVVDADGEMIAVGEEGYTEAAIANRIDLDLFTAEGEINESSFELESGSIYAPYIVVEGNIDGLGDNDSSNDPTVFFSYLGANSDSSEHIKILGDNTIGFEHALGGGDLDFDDLVVEYDFV